MEHKEVKSTVLSAEEEYHDIEHVLLRKKAILIIAAILTVALLLGISAVAANIGNNKQMESESVTCPANGNECLMKADGSCRNSDGVCPMANSGQNEEVCSNNSDVCPRSDNSCPMRGSMNGNCPRGR